MMKNLIESKTYYIFKKSYGYYCFAKAINGSIERLYDYNDHTNEYHTIGTPTRAELGYNFPNILPWEIDEEDQD